MNTTVTKPLLTDETGKEVVDGLKLIAKRVAEQGSAFYYELRIEIETGSICRASTGIPAGTCRSSTPTTGP